MKKIATILMAAAILTSNGAFAAQPTANVGVTTGNGAYTGYYNARTFSWWTTITGVAILAAVVVPTAIAASHDQSSFSH